MLSNFLGTILIHAEALLGRDHQKLIDEGLHVLANEFACWNIPGHNLSVGFHGLISHERRVPIPHLVHKHAQRPVVRCPVMAVGLDDFWGEVVRSTAECVCFIAIQLLCEPQVDDLGLWGAWPTLSYNQLPCSSIKADNYLQITFTVEHKVLRFEIPVDDAKDMHVLERQQDLAGVELGGFVVEANLRCGGVVWCGVSNLDTNSVHLCR